MKVLFIVLVLVSLFGCSEDPVSPEKVFVYVVTDESHVFNYKQFEYFVLGEGLLVTERIEDSYYSQFYLNGSYEKFTYTGVSTSESTFEGVTFNGVEYVFTIGDTLSSDTVFHENDTVKIIYRVQCEDTVVVNW